jgi:uncharacterized membrane protein
MEYLLWKWLHILSSTLLFGTGIGTAFAMFLANRSGDVHAMAVVTRNVVLADWLFTLPMVIFQPISGYMMMRLAGIPLAIPWIRISFALYLLAVACWLPVVWLQFQMRDMAQEAAMSGASVLRRATGATNVSG